MAHFAELDNTNRVLRVVVIDNKDISDENGVEHEDIGTAFCKKLFGVETNWIQTSYNANIRGKYAGTGDLYDPTKDEFVYDQEWQDAERARLEALLSQNQENTVG